MLPLIIVVSMSAGTLTSPLSAQGGGQAATEKLDTAAIQKIKDEGFKNSQIMDIMSWLTDVYGPRLTNSPITKRAGDWTLAQFQKWGLANPRYETWGPFGRGWVNDRMIAQVTSPVAFPVIAYPGAWAEGTGAMVSSEVVYVPNTVNTVEAFAPYKGKLKGKIVISAPARDVPAMMTAPGTRNTTEQLNALANPFPPAAGRLGGGGRQGGGPGRQGGAPAGAAPSINLQACLMQEGVTAILTPGGGNSNGGNVFNGSGNRNAPKSIPSVALTPEHYGRIFRILQKGIPVKMDLDVRNTFYTQDLNTFNILADIPGTDKADEVVMLGAHFDSWQGGTGATDNAAGSAVMMEAMRILKTLNLPMRRTVRIGLWTGEEQG
ncbi:MAG: M28 family peptidase, partial [Longimicrobiales bacterium]